MLDGVRVRGLVHRQYEDPCVRRHVLKTAVVSKALSSVEMKMVPPHHGRPTIPASAEVNCCSPLPSTGDNTYTAAQHTNDGHGHVHVNTEHVTWSNGGPPQSPYTHVDFRTKAHPLPHQSHHSS